MHGLHSQLGSLVVSLCRAGTLLALLQLVAWVANLAGNAGKDDGSSLDRTVAGIAYLHAVGEPGLDAIVGLDAPATGVREASSTLLIRYAREFGRIMFWGVVLLVLPLGLVLGIGAPFLLPRVEAQRMLFGTVALLGVLPLVRSESMPAPWREGGLPAMPESLLAGAAVPFVALVLLASASVLFDLQRHRGPDPRPDHGPAGTLSSSDVRAIIRRGEPSRFRSSRSRRTAR